MNDEPSHLMQNDMLTAKQRDVLELLIRHKTSKEIARILGISPYTVDQRIMAARKKLGVRTRNELAEAYRLLPKLYEESAYQFSYVDNAQIHRQEDVGTASESLDPAGHPIPAFGKQARSGVSNYRVVPEIFEGPNGIWARLLAIGLLAIMLLITVLGGVAAFGQLSDLLRQQPEYLLSSTATPSGPEESI